MPRHLTRLKAASRRVLSGLTQSKQKAELTFWRNEIRRYVDWYNGSLPMLYKTPAPTDSQKIRASSLEHSSILTWHKLHQQVKYLEDLALAADAFRGMKLLDVGAGPMASATCFQGAELYCLEPLLPHYLEAGFPIHCYGSTRFICAPSEQIPVADGFFDAAIAVNAMDHVDDVAAAAAEIRRVLKPGGYFRMHVHYHPPAACEPVSFSDELFLRLFGWSPGLRKIRSSRSSHSTDLPAGESFALWSNFDTRAS